jgi:hypothetical protein
MTTPAAAVPPRRPPAALRAIAQCLTLALALAGCASRAPRSDPGAAPEAALDETRARQIVAVWQRQLADYIRRTGAGDPAVLAQLPARRATGTLRPARITFGALDVDASAAERDGFDVQGLLLPAPRDAAAFPYVFVVGIVRREGYRPAALVDIRLVTLAVRGARLEWWVGDGDAQALARYLGRRDRSLPLRFPADADRFELLPCAPRWCVDEPLSAARWSAELQPADLARAAP